MPLFSYLFHPLFIGIYGALLYFVITPYWFDYQEIYVAFLQIIILTILIPITLFYLLLSLGKITSFVSPSLQDRKIPLFISIFLYTLLLFKGVSFHHFAELFYFFASIVVMNFLAIICLFLKIKISIHAAGMSLLTFFALGMSISMGIEMISLLSLLILINGLVGSSRLFMKAHTLEEWIYGVAFGSLAQISSWYFWL